MLGVISFAKMSNHFGQIFRATSFGESHGPALGVVIDGCPAGVSFDEKLLVSALKRRRPGASALQSARAEVDIPKVLSGIFESKTLGTPIAVIVENSDAQSKAYEFNREASFRKGHADDMWAAKFSHFDWRGGGRASGRETLSRVIVGAFAQMFLNELCPNLDVKAFSSQIYNISLDAAELKSAAQMPLSEIDSYAARMPSKAKSQELEELLLKAKLEGKSYGGVAQLLIRNAPQGLGEPVFAKMKAVLAQAFMSIGAVTAVEIGEGFDCVGAEGSQFHSKENNSNVYGGIRGGITTGEDISVRIAFKPTSSVLDVAKRGRHDPCIVPRALPVIEAMTLWVLADMILLKRLNTCQ